MDMKNYNTFLNENTDEIDKEYDSTYNVTGKDLIELIEPIKSIESTDILLSEDTNSIEEENNA